MSTVQIQLKSWDSRIPGFQLDLKIVYEFQLRMRSFIKYLTEFEHETALGYKTEAQMRPFEEIKNRGEKSRETVRLRNA
jgi:hypothetical protein